ncbi:MAG: hypothetical protein KGL39_10060 [Patescibacteria group bacterium]|nr:hypothetical protein [Patescibacteria group bacterium]
MKPVHAIGRCGKTGKAMFRTHNAAMLRASEIMENDDCNATQFRAYRCLFCGSYHLTSQEFVTNRNSETNKTK